MFNTSRVTLIIFSFLISGHFLRPRNAVTFELCCGDCDGEICIPLHSRILRKRVNGLRRNAMIGSLLPGTLCHPTYNIAAFLLRGNDLQPPLRHPNTLSRCLRCNRGRRYANDLLRGQQEATQFKLHVRRNIFHHHSFILFSLLSADITQLMVRPSDVRVRRVRPMDNQLHFQSQVVHLHGFIQLSLISADITQLMIRPSDVQVRSARSMAYEMLVATPPGGQTNFTLCTMATIG